MDRSVRIGDVDVGSLWVRTIRMGLFRYEATNEEGDRILSGLSIGTDGKTIESFIINETKGELYAAATMKDVGRFTIILDRVRAYRPGRKTIRQPGRQPDIENRDPWHVGIGDSLARLRATNGAWALIHNIAPIKKTGHMILVPFEGTRLVEKEQVMDKESYTDILEFYRASAGLLFYFNGLHAGATKNQFHVQVVCDDADTPLYKTLNGARSGTILDYPATVVRFDVTDHDRAWALIDFLQKEDIPQNILIARGSIMVIPRNIGHEVVECFKQEVFGTIDLTGVITVVSESDFVSVSRESDIVEAFSLATLSRAKTQYILDRLSIQPI